MNHASYYYLKSIKSNKLLFSHDKVQRTKSFRFSLLQFSPQAHQTIDPLQLKSSETNFLCETERHREKNEPPEEPCDFSKAIDESVKSDESIENRLMPVDKDDFYLIGDHVDCLHPDIGAWFEGKVCGLVTSVNIKRKIVQGTLFIGDKVTLDKHNITGNSVFYAVQDNQPVIERNGKQAKLIANG